MCFSGASITPRSATCVMHLAYFRSLHAVAPVTDTSDSLRAYCAEMVHAASASQRLFETPIPVSYTRHTSRSLMLWLLSLPFALWTIMGTSMVPACLVISYVSAHDLRCI